MDCGIAPTFTQTGWFIVLCIIATVGALGLPTRWRASRVAQRLRWHLDGRLEALLGGRDRLARELHDTLLQSAQGLILRFQAISNKMPDDDLNRELRLAAERGGWQ